MRKPISAVSIALLLGLVLFGLSLMTTHTPGGSINGYPLTINHPVSPCSTPNPFNGCGFVYDPFVMLLDILFWVAIGWIPAVPFTFVLIPSRAAS